MPTPVVTIAIACRDEESRVEALLRQARAQDWPREQLEIVVADGMSMDGTREVLARVAGEDDRVRLVENLARTRAAGLNECIRRARGEVVVRFDAGAQYGPDYVGRCVAALERNGADGVGGAARPRGKGFFQRCVAAALRSPIGVRGRKDGADRGWADGVQPTAFRRDVFERVGLYDPRAATDEDAELDRRIGAAGGRLEKSDEIAADYAPRDSVKRLARQSFAFGRGRARTLLKHGRFSSWGPSLPLLWLAGEAVFFATARRRALPWSVAAYALATGAEAVRVGASEGALAVPVVWAIFPVLHVAHGLGFAAGLARYVLRPDWETAERLDSVPPEAPTATAGV